ncbi:MAG: HD domain-containing protein [Treponema sp.]|nr:HD domain-containing protein [Treponema sp.]
MKRTSLFFLILTTFISFGFSQNKKTDDTFFKDFVSRNWNAESGLPGNTITDIMQDSDGYMYFGTYSGLLRFDGVEFVSINRLYDERYDFISARTMFQDSRGNMWIGSNDEGIVCIKKTGEFLKYTVKDGLPNNSIRAFCEDKEGNVWVGTASGLSCIGKNYLIQKIPGIEDLPNDNKFIINQLYCDTAGRLWIITRSENGLYCYAGEKFERSNIITCVENPVVSAVMQDSSGAFWFGVAPYYAVKVTSDEEILYDIGNGSQKGTIITCIFQDSAKNLWFALDNGITVLHDGIMSYCDTGHLLADDSINEIMEDKEQNIWLALDRAGIQKLSYGKFQTTNMPTTVNAIVKDTFRDLVWLGCDKGLACYKNNQFQENEITEYCKNTRIRHVAVTDNGALLVSCYEKHGQIRFNLDGSVENWTRKDGLAGDRVRVAEESKNGDIYVGTTTGLSIIDGKTKEITNIVKNEILDNDFIMCIYEDEDGSVWFGTDGGGVYVIKDKEIVKKYTKEDGLSGNVVFKISSLRPDELWICTGSGLTVMSKTDEKIFNFDSSNGFTVDGVFQVLSDYTQRIWATSNQGIFYVKLNDMEEFMRGERNSLAPTYFTRLDGITSGGVTSTSLSAKDEKGRLWFTLIDGFTVMDPVRNASNSYAPTVKIQSVMLDNEKVDFSDNETIVIKPAVKRLSIKYTGISFISSEQVTFRTKLDGFDKDFTEWTTDRISSYTNLTPGNYVFHVIAQNADGVQSSTEAKLSITKTPYLWERPWFIVLIIVIVVGAVALIVFLRFDSYRKRQEEIQKLSIEVTSALAQTIDAKDKYTKGHSNRVAKYSKMLAEELGEDKKTQERIYYAALLHDIGKIGIPIAIINKPDKLTEEEYEIIKTHPAIGGEILKQISSMPEIAIGARSHHERYDGKGYPDGLVGENIPWIARIIGVADAYDAMTSNRSYRNYLPQEKVKAEIIKYKGIQFDPKVADAMIKLINEDVYYEMHE